ncbi:acetyl-CoA carboxylase biotin carboxyl carrier protein [Gloeobacter kilaueensis]|uniref:Biotin carboxyl carrier protein of acetyl-CoA carboxylase n=1 Tax=Gloeobacter kilaueensis (strain ATCC BAA-2537 / CCAP 1431/1 / ULC 316 / JS1) TaxID=1183438 RepID=U5QII8_GLOK1|nr:acetyl-CoA carboxylase biotin carboxyl carrier protein [Gloeobacter kilaueensis]AGY58746.1 acetyl-CoA carboxylase, biotin carboxyl carrier protein [Gloeobacter kilaueensis JS1]
MNIDLSEIRELIAILNQTDVTELTIEAEGFRLSIRKEGGKVVVQSPAALPLPEVANAVPPAAPAEKSVAPPAVSEPAKPTIEIVAPMVGTFYRAPSPDTPNFVEPGTAVQIGQTVCIIEAMKLMNTIDSEVAGRVVEILVENGEPVEYGQKLMRLEAL